MIGRIVLSLLIAWLALAGTAHAQEAKVRTIPFEGAEVFCHILYHNELQPIKSLDALAADPDRLDSLLIVFGRMDRLHEIYQAVGSLENYRRTGGSLLIVTDYDFQAPDLAIGTRGVKILQPKQSAYGGAELCPWLPRPTGGDHPLFHMLRKGIATNSPSSAFIRPGDPEAIISVSPLLLFPKDVQRMPPGGPGKGPKTWPPAYMVGSGKDAPPHGRILFIAGQGMFMNGMMLQSDNDNFDFAVNAIHWLREGPDGTTRGKALLMVDGVIVSDFNMSLSPRPELPPPQIPVPPVKALNRLIRGMEEERLFHKMLRGLLGDSFERVIGVMIALATFMLLLYGAKKFLEGRHLRETAVPSMVGTAPPLGPAAPRGQQRQRALQLQADASAAQQLVHAWLRAEFGVQPEQWSAGTRVELQASGFVWTRWGLQRQATWILELARAPESTRVTRHSFADLVAALPELSGASKEGQLTLLVDGKNVRQVSG